MSAQLNDCGKSAPASSRLVIALHAAEAPSPIIEDGTTTIVRQTFGANCQPEQLKHHVESRLEAMALAKRLHDRNPRTGKRRSLRAISAELAAAGHLSELGNALAPRAIRAMLAR
jgi:hypothetical protein